jgi:hypothetical protein
MLHLADRFVSVYHPTELKAEIEGQALLVQLVRNVE